jgi:hypothetical protein
VSSNRLFFLLGKTWESNHFPLVHLGPSSPEKFVKFFGRVPFIIGKSVGVTVRHTIPAVAQTLPANRLWYAKTSASAVQGGSLQHRGRHAAVRACRTPNKRATSLGSRKASELWLARSQCNSLLLQKEGRSLIAPALRGGSFNWRYRLQALWNRSDSCTGDPNQLCQEH